MNSELSLHQASKKIWVFWDQNSKIKNNSNNLNYNYNPVLIKPHKLIHLPTFWEVWDNWIINRPLLFLHQTILNLLPNPMEQSSSACKIEIYEKAEMCYESLYKIVFHHTWYTKNIFDMISITKCCHNIVSFKGCLFCFWITLIIW